MASVFDHVAARLAYWHAQRVYGRFQRALRDVSTQQQRVLERVLPIVRESEFGREHGLGTVRTPSDLRGALPLTTYEDYRPYVQRVARGETGALFSRGQRVLMFATSSGTTDQPKWIPVTQAFVSDYRRGWNTFGLKLLTDHPRAILRAILQSSGRHDAEYTPAGIPCGAITGLLALSQKRIVRRYYVGRPEITHISPPTARYYTLMRMAVVRDVAFAITANPATLIQLARTADEHSETLIRDVHDGTLAESMVGDDELRRRLSAGLRADPQRAAELSRLRSVHGALRPRDYWQVEFLACWTGGSLGHYLQRLADSWGPVPVRDVGLLASEGRVSLPLNDQTPVGVLDVTSALFEFIPAEQADAPAAETLWTQQLETGRDYVVVLSNTTGLLRYRLDDVVRVHGWMHGAPLIEFLHRAGRVASVAGEKLTENQVVAAVQAACRELGIEEFDFVIAPRWDEPPHYRLSCPAVNNRNLARAVDRQLCEQNEEYASRRSSKRLGELRLRTISSECFVAMDDRLRSSRRATAEQYKRPTLFINPGEDDGALGLAADG